MQKQNQSSKRNSWRQLGMLLRPRNLLRTLGVNVPGVASFLEIQSQIDGQQVTDQLGELEQTDAALQQKLQQLEAAQPHLRPPDYEWPLQIDEYSRRIVDLVVLYDGVFDSPDKAGHELFLAVAHGCFIGPSTVVTCSEALAVAQGISAQRNGRVAIMSGMARYECACGAADPASGLVVCQVTRDEDRWREACEEFEAAGLQKFVTEPLTDVVKATVTPWLGQEVGFLHTGEAVDVFRFHGLTHLQFDSTVVSHFKKPRPDTLKSFVTSVLPGRITRLGSPVFVRSGELVGFVAGTESYASDTSARAVVKSLLGHPLFTAFENGR